ncbi:hypothetical protein PFISCL1PPCAC_6627, partial [Pristionchus fissidentatus]
TVARCVFDMNFGTVALSDPTTFIRSVNIQAVQLCFQHFIVVKPQISETFRNAFSIYCRRASITIYVCDISAV